MASSQLTGVELGAMPLDRYRHVLEEETWTEFESTMRTAAGRLRGRTVWNINSTARGGGVAELLSALIPYDRGAGIDARWLVIQGSPEFFDVTKKLHRMLHGAGGEDGGVTPEECAIYEETQATNAAALADAVRPGDVVLLHDPQTAGLARALSAMGCTVIWRCHVGVDEPNESVRMAWTFLRGYVASAASLVFSRRRYVWDGTDPAQARVIAPSIDAFTTKNQELDEAAVLGLLRAGGILGRAGGDATFVRTDGSRAHVCRHASGIPPGGLPVDAPLVVQVSRWDPLKDPMGVMEGFAAHIAPETPAHLVLAGPAATSVTDDPEQPSMLAALRSRREALPEDVKSRVHIAELPMEDEDENAALVNALQRHAAVVVQKSLAEGFGLTVAEAMWKAKPVVASQVGGIEDQVEHGKSGILVDDPRDLKSFGQAVVRLLRDERLAGELGTGARRRVTRHFLAPRHLSEQAQLIVELLDRPD